MMKFLTYQLTVGEEALVVNGTAALYKAAARSQNFLKAIGGLVFEQTVWQEVILLDPA
jgi:hypothetical protein